ncbi:MAG: VCBS repeat-containing protein, partial [Acidobacteriota bacterium]
GHMSARGGDDLVVLQNYDNVSDSGLYTLDYDTLLNRQKIPNTALGDLDPSWSYDGQLIAYANTEIGSRGRIGPFLNLFTIKQDGSNKTQLTFLSPPPGEGFSYSLVWTLDNLTILNAAKLNGVSAIYKISATGGGILGTVPITPGAAPQWVGGIAPVYGEQQTASFGGGVTSGGTYTLVDTLGQAFAGQTSSGGVYNLQSGFWTNAATRRSPVDFDGDGKTDVSIFRPAAGGAEWWYRRSSDDQVPAFQFGAAGDKPVPVDFTGDGKADASFWRPSTGQWFILRSEDFSFYAFPFGSPGDIPMPADYDGDGKADPTLFRPSTGIWFISRSSDGQVTFAQFGVNGDQPVASDYDGDGKADIGIFRPAGASGGAEWWIQRSTAGPMSIQFGSSTDRAVPGDYTGDGKTDLAFWRPADGSWYVLRSEDLSFFAFPFGASGDLPVPGDYDGDGKADAAIFRPSQSTWFISRSTAGLLITQFGISTDQPLPGAFVR